MFKLLLCLLFIGVVFSQSEEDRGLREYFLSLDPNKVERSGEVKRCKNNRRNSNNDQEPLKENLPNLTDVKSKPYEYPGVNLEEIRDCIEKKLGIKLTDKLPEQKTEEPLPKAQRRFNLPEAEIEPITIKSIVEVKSPELLPNKTDIQSDSLQLNTEGAAPAPAMRQLTDYVQPIVYPVTPKVIDLCAEPETDFDNYKNTQIRRSMEANVIPLNEVEPEKVNINEKSDDKTIVRSGEELEDPTNRMGVSQYNRGNVIGSRRICYACSTLNNPTCVSPSKLTTVKYCNGNRNSCISKTYEGQDGIILIRDCASTCNESTVPAGIAPKYKTCSICHSDLCNAAASINTEHLLFIIFVSCATLYKTLA